MNNQAIDTILTGRYAEKEQSPVSSLNLEETLQMKN